MTLWRILYLATLLTFVALPTAAQEAASDPAEQAQAGPAESETGPELPAQVTERAIPLDELTVRLTPLTKDELAALAEVWLDIAQTATEEVADAQIALRRAEGAAEARARERLGELTEERNALFEKFMTVVESFATKGGDEAIVADYRAYRNAVIVEEVRAADFRTILESLTEWLVSPDGGVGVAIEIGIVILALVGLLAAARIVRGLAGRGVRRIPNISRLLRNFLLVVIYWFTVAIGLMIVLSALGVDVTPLFAVLGGASFILAFALQETLGNLAAGLMIMTTRPFDEGDYVDLAGTSGTVQHVSITRTTLATPDNQIIHVPNSQAWGNVITNVTARDTRRVDLVFGVSYDDDLKAVQRALEETVAAHPLVLKDPEPMIKVNALNSSSIDFICRPWVRGDDYWTVYWDLTRLVKERFDRDGITIPFPQQDVHVHAVDARLHDASAR